MKKGMTVADLKAILAQYNDNDYILLEGGEGNGGEWATLKVGTYNRPLGNAWWFDRDAVTILEDEDTPSWIK